jgi:small subunit ribosomal protein S20
VANIKQAKKRARQSIKSRQYNKHYRTKMRTSIKRVYAAIKAEDQEAARTQFKKAEPIIDSMVSKGIIHKNKAARHKSRLAKHIKNLAEQAA